MFVVTVDQRGSRRGSDLVAGLLLHLAAVPVVRPFERTAGDEVQGVLGAADAVVEVVLDLVRESRWSIGVGVGPVREPLPPSTRAGHGPAFTHARTAVGRAKNRPTGLAVVGDAAEVPLGEAVLDLVAAVVARRSERGWAAVDLARRGLTQAEIARRLGISKQAVSQRLAAADWHLEPGGRAAAAHLLALADDPDRFVSGAGGNLRPS